MSRAYAAGSECAGTSPTRKPPPQAARECATHVGRAGAQARTAALAAVVAGDNLQLAALAAKPVARKPARLASASGAGSVPDPSGTTGGRLTDVSPARSFGCNRSTKRTHSFPGTLYKVARNEFPNPAVGFDGCPLHPHHRHRNTITGTQALAGDERRTPFEKSYQLRPPETRRGPSGVPLRAVRRSEYEENARAGRLGQSCDLDLSVASVNRSAIMAGKPPLERMLRSLRREALGFPTAARGCRWISPRKPTPPLDDRCSRHRSNRRDWTGPLASGAKAGSFWSFSFACDFFPPVVRALLDYGHSPRSRSLCPGCWPAPIAVVGGRQRKRTG